MPKPTRPAKQPPGVCHFRLGDAVVTALNDGMLGDDTFNFFDAVTNLPKSEAEALHRATFRALTPRLAVNAFLLHLSDKLVLVDGG